jgi:hypothetical protein
MLTNKELIIKRKKREDKRKAERRDLFLKKVKALYVVGFVVMTLERIIFLLKHSMLKKLDRDH